MKKILFPLLLIGTALATGEARGCDNCPEAKPRVSWGVSLNFGPSQRNGGYYRRCYTPQRRVVVHHFPAAARVAGCCGDDCTVDQVHHVYHHRPMAARPAVRGAYRHSAHR